MPKLSICPECGAANGPARRACKQCGLVINLNAPQQQTPEVHIPDAPRPRPKFIAKGPGAKAAPWSARPSSMVMIAASVIVLTLCAVLAVSHDKAEAVIWIAAPFVGIVLAAIPAAILTHKGHKSGAAWLMFFCGLLLWPLWPLCLVVALVAAERER